VNLLELFCKIDDFWQEFEAKGLQTLATNRLQRRRGVMSMSEMMTIERTSYLYYM
jgi:hypothetical protein